MLEYNLLLCKLLVVYVQVEVGCSVILFEGMHHACVVCLVRIMSFSVILLGVQM